MVRRFPFPPLISRTLTLTAPVSVRRRLLHSRGQPSPVLVLLGALHRLPDVRVRPARVQRLSGHHARLRDTRGRELLLRLSELAGCPGGVCARRRRRAPGAFGPDRSCFSSLTDGMFAGSQYPGHQLQAVRGHPAPHRAGLPRYALLCPSVEEAVGE